MSAATPRPSHTRSPYSSLITHCSLLLFLSYPLVFLGLGDRDLWSSHEGRAAQEAQSVLTGPDWRLPRLLDGRPDLQKPPLYYWLAAGAAWCRGQIDAVAVRLPAAVGAILGALAVYVLLWRRGRPLAGLL